MPDDTPQGDKQVHPRNSLNALTGREWIRFTKSWTDLDPDVEETAVCHGQPRCPCPEPDSEHFDRSWTIIDSRRYRKNKDVEMHPARYPEELVAEFVEFFTKPGQWVLDPFAGTAATAVAAAELDRFCVATELSQHYARMAQRRFEGSPLDSRVAIRHADIRDLPQPSFWTEAAVPDLPLTETGLPLFDFIMTSPPYWNMLRHSRGGVESTHKKRAKAGLDTIYSDDPRDLGNIEDYGEFVAELGRLIGALKPLLRPTRYLVVVAQNMRAPSGEVMTFAWDLQRALSEHYLFQGERIWCQNSKQLGIWGYPTTFVPNYHHHYCLIFRRTE